MTCLMGGIPSIPNEEDEMGWREILLIPEIVDTLKARTLDMLTEKLARAKAYLKYAQSLPDGREIFVIDESGAGGSAGVTKDEYITQVTAEIAEIEAQIAELG